MSYQAIYRDIEPEVYVNIRAECGLFSKTVEAARIGLANSLCSVSLIDEESNRVIGMGRLIGDGGCSCQVSDICVLPEFQGKGLSKLIMQKLDEYIKANLPDSCFVSLISVGEAHKLYRQFNFKVLPEDELAMGYRVVK